MAIFEERFQQYLLTLINGERGPEDKNTWLFDPILPLLMQDVFLFNSTHFLINTNDKLEIISKNDPIHAFGLVNKIRPLKAISIEVERKLIALKLGFPHLPATTATIILKGFGENIVYEDTLKIFASHGLTRIMRNLSNERSFIEINRRAAGWFRAVESPDSEFANKIRIRFNEIYKWLTTPKGKKMDFFKGITMKRSLFFHWWNNFQRLGLLGLSEPGIELFRQSKIGPDMEAKIVVDRLQHPKRNDSYYVDRLASEGIKVQRDTITKIFVKWRIDKWNSAFVSNLKRLESDDFEDIESDNLFIDSDIDQSRFVEQKYFEMIKGLSLHTVPLSNPFLLLLWAYIEELGLLKKLNQMQLNLPCGKEYYSWLDFLLFDIGRRFIGIPTLSGAIESASSDLAWFSHLYSPPCKDTLLNGLTHISEQKVVKLRQWLVKRLAELGLGSGKRIAFDFHQIDLDVQMSNIREFGKGPSPNKNQCYTGFRPHIAWDVENNTLLVAEFRKSSARGTTSFRRYTKDYILPAFQNLFETVYVDSEYTGKDVWNYIIDSENGMGADLTACLKQNRLVQKARDKFLSENEGSKDFWKYYDDEYCYTTKTFVINWTYIPNSEQEKKLELNCVVKRNMKNGRLRCFGSSKKNINSTEILKDYSSRWIIENGIKDLIHSYFMDRCPGTRPHAVDVHFIITTICKTIYRMIERDLGEYVYNSDGTRKTLERMREILFKHGCSDLRREDDQLIITLHNSYRIEQTNLLNYWIAKVKERHKDGLKILGGMSIEFKINPPRGKDYKNSGVKMEFSPKTIIEFF